jgi:hypothetical protein
VGHRVALDWVLVGVHHLREVPVALLYLFECGVFWDLQHLVGVGDGKIHGGSNSCFAYKIILSQL